MMAIDFVSKRNAWAGSAALAWLAAALAWALAVAAVAYWLQPVLWPVAADAPAANPPAVAKPPVVIDTALVAHALGAPPQAAPGDAAPAEDLGQRFALVGVVRAASQTAQKGAVDVALIAVDGQPARPFRVGAALDDRWRIQGLSAQGVGLAALDAPADAPAAVTLPMPTLPLASVAPAPQ